MAVCQECGREMLDATTCTVEAFVFPDGAVPRITFGAEKPKWRMERCGDCGVRRGGYHHPGCDIEQCAICRQQLISCGCLDPETETTHREDPWVDVPTAIGIVAKILLREAPDLQRNFDHLFIDPVAACGHVGRGHVQKMSRDVDAPLNEWFELGHWMGEETAAILFTCRSSDFESVTDVDLDVAARMVVYAENNAELPWELVFVTRSGNFKASDLLGLPGHPQFESCTYDGIDDLSASGW